MESSALFVVAKYRGVQVASIQVVSDIVPDQGKWMLAFRDSKVTGMMRGVLKSILGQPDRADAEGATPFA